MLLLWIEKQSSHGCLLKYLESSDANIMIRGNYWERVIWWKKQASKQLLMMNVWEGFSDRNFFFHCQFATLEMY